MEKSARLVDEEDHQEPVGRAQTFPTLTRPVADIFIPAELGSVYSPPFSWQIMIDCRFRSTNIGNPPGASIYRRDWEVPAERRSSTAYPYPSKAKKAPSNLSFKRHTSSATSQEQPRKNQKPFEFSHPGSTWRYCAEKPKPKSWAAKL
jgi:hypothetical protein